MCFENGVDSPFATMEHNSRANLHRRTSSLHRCICIIRYTIIFHSKLILLEILLGMRPNLDKSTCRYLI